MTSSSRWLVAVLHDKKKRQNLCWTCVDILFNEVFSYLPWLLAPLTYNFLKTSVALSVIVTLA